MHEGNVSGDSAIPAIVIHACLAGHKNPIQAICHGIHVGHFHAHVDCGSRDIGEKGVRCYFGKTDGTERYHVGFGQSPPVVFFCFIDKIFNEQFARK